MAATETSSNFDVFYIGVEEAKSAHLKHCHEATQSIISKAKKDDKRRRKCMAKVFVHSVEIYFPQETQQNSMRIPTHFMQVTGVDPKHRKVCFLCVAGKRRNGFTDKVGVFTFLCDSIPQAESFVTAISRAFQLEYQNWHQGLVKHANHKQITRRPTSEIVGQPGTSEPDQIVRHSSVSHPNDRHGNQVPIPAPPPEVAQNPSQKPGLFKISKNKRASKIVDEAQHQQNQHSNGREMNLMHDYGAHVVPNGKASHEENQLPESVIQELQERLKRMNKAEDDDQERTEVFTLRMKTKKYPHLITD